MDKSIQYQRQMNNTDLNAAQSNRTMATDTEVDNKNKPTILKMAL